MHEFRLEAPTDHLREQFDDGTYPDGFWNWIAQNWHIYDGARDLARKAKRHGVHRWSIKAVLEVLRWHTALRERGTGEVLKVNNNAAPGLARLIMAREPDLDGFFSTRTPPARRDAIRLNGAPYLDP